MSTNRHLLLQDLDALYTSIVSYNAKHGIIMSRMQICEQIATMPAPRLYISLNRARILTFNFERYRAKKHKVTGRHLEFYRRWLALPPSQRTTQSIPALLDQPAPSFYLSPKYIYRTLYRIYDRRE